MLFYILSGAVFHSWRCKITFAIAKLLFSLSAAPFFPLTIGFINTLFTHADATAYTPDGRLTSIDTNGLSAFITWLGQVQLEMGRSFP